MKYLGKKSLSSLLVKILHIFWYLMIPISILCFFFLFVMLFLNPLQYNEILEVTKELNWYEDWKDANSIPFILKLLIIPYLLINIFLLMKILRISRELFKNFENDIIFNKNNVTIISKIGKFIIIFSILTFNLSSLIAGILLLILCEIFKNGTYLQEEHDLTI